MHIGVDFFLEEKNTCKAYNIGRAGEKEWEEIARKNHAVHKAECKRSVEQNDLWFFCAIRNTI